MRRFQPLDTKRKVPTADVTVGTALPAHIHRIVTYKPQHAYIERAQAMPKQGASSGFKYGRAVGAIEATLACCEIPTNGIYGISI
jgi:hypothetical protein